MALLPSAWQDKVSVSNLTDETHVWAIQLRQSPVYQPHQFEWLSEKEKDKAQRMLVCLKRDYLIQAKAWLRWLLAQYVGTTPEQINYRYGSLGKPYLASKHKQLFFNASDSGATLLCTFSNKHELGIDIESTPRNVNYQRIAEKKFTEQEQAAIKTTPATTQNKAFLALWTRKEAFGKALGVGIRYPMNQFNLCNTLNTYKQKITDQQKREWILFQFSHTHNIACLASSQNHEKINFYRLDIDSVKLNHG